MMANWFSNLFGEQTLDAISNALISAYGWAKEWQILLAGVLVLLAALIVARALRRTPPPAPKSIPTASQLDLRAAPQPLGSQQTPDELVGELEQLRSLIRSALAAFTLTAEKENSPVQFLCQRVARLRPERFPLAEDAAKTHHQLYTALLEQMEVLRQQLKKEAQPLEISATLVQLNTNARNLVTALAPLSASPVAIRRQAGSEQR
jgi:hypothetical protein